MRPLILPLLFATAVLSAPLRVDAETTAQQRFLVRVPPRLTIQAPPAEAIAHLPPDEAQVQVPQQVWDISSNTSSGATVQFATEQSFHNLDDDSIRRDAQLNVSIVSQSRAGCLDRDPIRGRHGSPVRRGIGLGPGPLRSRRISRDRADGDVPARGRLVDAGWRLCDDGGGDNHGELSRTRGGKFAAWWITVREDLSLG